MSTDTGSISQGKSSGIVRSGTYAEHEDRVRADRTAPVCIVERGGNAVDEKEIYEICQSVDSAIAAELAESIMYKASFETLEAHHGILPISRRSFYRRRRTAQRLMRQRMAHLVEEKNGQMRMVWRND